MNRRELLLLLTTVLLFQLSFPPFNLWPLGLVCLVPWLYVLQSASPRVGLRSGFLVGMGIALPQMDMIRVLVSRWTGSWGLSLVPWILASLVITAFFMLFGWLATKAYSRGWDLAIPWLWAGVEVLRSYCPGLAFPWALLATPLFGVAPRGLAFAGTIYLVGFAVVLLQVAVVRSLVRKKATSKLWLLAGWLLLLDLGGRSLYIIETSAMLPKTISVAQPGLDFAFGNPSQAQIAETVSSLLSEGRGSNLVVLPEGLVQVDAKLPPQLPFQIPDPLPVVFGAHRGFHPSYQSAFGKGKNGKWTVADKSRLVVFGEYVPGRDYIPFLDKFQLPAGDLQAGTKVETLQVDGLKVGPLICFEELFFDIADQQSRSGAQVLAVLSIDDWYMGTAAPEQLMQAAVWRSLETGLPMARSCTTGISCLVDEFGNSWPLPIGERSCLSMTVDVVDSGMTYPLRPVFPWMAVLSIPAILIAGRRRSGI